MFWQQDSSSQIGNDGEDCFPEILSLASLRSIAAWIRDDLDILVAREGPGVLKADDVLSLHDVLVALRSHSLPEKILRFSRIHLAVKEIRGKATRWPGKLVDEADRVIEALEADIGSLVDIKTSLYEPGARLNGICDPSDVGKEAILRRFAEQDRSNVDDHRAYHHGTQNFQPGQWWINGLFAFRDGIIDSKSIEGGISWNQNGAYAIVLSGSDEVDTAHPNQFTYRACVKDRGRFRLTSADYKSRHPVRVLRSHKLTSLWSPKAGIRYDGLYRVKGWTVRPYDQRGNDGRGIQYDIHFKAETLSFPEERRDWYRILKIPTADEVDDYMMFRRMQREQRELQRRGAQDIEPIAAGAVELWLQSNTPKQSISAAIPSEYGENMSTAKPRAISELDADQPILNFDLRHTENTSHLDGSVDKAEPTCSVTRACRHSYVDLLPLLSKRPMRASGHQDLGRAPLGFAAVEPFATLRHHRSRFKDKSFDDSVDSRGAILQSPVRSRVKRAALPQKTSLLHSSHLQWHFMLKKPAWPFLDIHFKPINWNPTPWPRSRTAFDVSEDLLHLIAPFSDLTTDVVDIAVSPRCSTDKLRNSK